MKIPALVRQRLFLLIASVLLLINTLTPAFASSRRMTLLLPDTLSITTPQVASWIDGAKELGYELAILRNSDFLQLTSYADYPGIIVPDLIQVTMTDNLVNKLITYTNEGGQLMLVYDAGALNADGFYPIPKSRFSDFVGVDYVLYDELLDRTIGWGQIVGTSEDLRELSVPPGKGITYVPPGTTTTSSTTLSQSSTKTSTSKTTKSLAYYLPSSTTNVGGLKGYNPGIYFSQGKKFRVVTDKSANDKNSVLLKAGGYFYKQPAAVHKEKVKNTTSVNTMTFQTTMSGTSSSSLPMESISGYGYGVLNYPSFVTRGNNVDKTLLLSPDHGLVAGVRNVGAGAVLFVNTPLTYLKLYEDAMLMHGYINWFAREMVYAPQLAEVPNGVGGLVFNWHLDSNAAITPMQTLTDMGVWNYGPFSIDITAGPDVVSFGDHGGFDLPNNAGVQQFLKDREVQHHQIGNHGGWIHNYYGFNVSETNQSDFQPYLELNKNAVAGVMNHASSEYSAPEGNNPLWSLTWLEQNGVTSYYSLSHTGSSPLRTYRQGFLRNAGLMSFPLTPFGVGATFEDFAYLNIPASDVNTWYDDLIEFCVDSETSRLIYAHPPGAITYSDTLMHLLNTAEQKKSEGKFKWYTMSDLTTFLTNRENVQWSSEVLLPENAVKVTATHPVSLAGMTWMYPKEGYAQPQILTGNIEVIERDASWLVRVIDGQSASFKAALL